MKKIIFFLSLSQIAASLCFATLPEAIPDLAIVPEGGTVSTLDTGATSLLANDTDVDLDPLSVTISPVNGPSHGSLALTRIFHEG